MARRRRPLNFNQLTTEISSLAEFFVIMAYQENIVAAYMSSISKIKRKIVPGLGTMAVRSLPDGSVELMYDDLFNDMVKVPEYRETPRKILLHEIIHVQDQHISRGITLYQSEEDKELFAKINGIAVDYACNSTGLLWGLYSEEELLSSAPHLLDDSGASLEDEEGRKISRFRGILPDEMDLPRNLSYENYYFLLKDIMNDKPPPHWEPPQPPEGESEDEPVSEPGNSPDGSPPPEGKEGNPPPKSKLQKAKDLIESRAKQQGQGIHLEDIIDGLTEEEMEAISQAAEHIAEELNEDLVNEMKSRGLTSHPVFGEISGRLKAPSIPWMQLLNAFIKNCSLKAGRIKSIRRPNRRRPDDGVLSPFPGTTRLKKANLVFVIDDSASVSNKDILDIKGELKSLHSFIESVTVIYCDSQINKIETLTASSEVRGERWGNGGTSFDPPFEWIKNSNKRIDGVIYATDGECCMVSEHLQVPLPLIWLITKGGCLPFEKGQSWSRRKSLEPGVLYPCSYGTALSLA